MESYGASRITFLDSAGAMTPKMVEIISTEILSVIDVPLGFHAHNNLHAAVANSLAAHASGCDAIDACIRGYVLVLEIFRWRLFGSRKRWMLYRS